MAHQLSNMQYQCGDKHRDRLCNNHIANAGHSQLESWTTTKDRSHLYFRRGRIVSAPRYFLFIRGAVRKVTASGGCGRTTPDVRANETLLRMAPGVTFHGRGHHLSVYRDK